jgi:hypothetical protein
MTKIFAVEKTLIMRPIALMQYKTDLTRIRCWR